MYSGGGGGLELNLCFKIYSHWLVISEQGGRGGPYSHGLISGGF